MKRNIDLTENRLFSSDNSFDELALRAMFFKEGFPWDLHLKEAITDDDLCFRHQSKAVIAVGDKVTRAKIKEYLQMENDDYCDCCGARMNLIPWNRELGLCHKCGNYYEKDIDKCRWRIKEEIRNAVIRIA